MNLSSNAIWLGIGGGGVLLSYAVHLRDPVFIYLRNLMLLRGTLSPKQTEARPSAGASA